MTSKAVAIKYEVAEITVRAWAKKNNIKRVLGAGGIMAYDFSDEDCKLFENRSKPGWKKGLSRKKD